MRYSQIIGILAAFVCIAAAVWLPWVSLGDITWTGLDAGQVFRKPGKGHIALAIIAIVLFLIPKMLAKQANLIFVTLNLAWALRNYLGMWRSNLDPAPTLNYGIYVLMVSSLLMFVMCLLAKVKIKE